MSHVLLITLSVFCLTRNWVDERILVKAQAGLMKRIFSEMELG